MWFYLNLQKWQFRTFVSAESTFLVCFTEVMARNFALHRLVNRNDNQKLQHVLTQRIFISDAYLKCQKQFLCTIANT